MKTIRNIAIGILAVLGGIKIIDTERLLLCDPGRNRPASRLGRGHRPVQVSLREESASLHGRPRYRVLLCPQGRQGILLPIATAGMKSNYARPRKALGKDGARFRLRAADAGIHGADQVGVSIVYSLSHSTRILRSVIAIAILLAGVKSGRSRRCAAGENCVRRLRTWQWKARSRRTLSRKSSSAWTKPP